MLFPFIVTTYICFCSQNGTDESVGAYAGLRLVGIIESVNASQKKLSITISLAWQRKNDRWILEDVVPMYVEYINKNQRVVGGAVVRYPISKAFIDESQAKIE